MSFWDELRLPAEYDLVVGFSDLNGFQRFAEQAEPLAVMAMLKGYFALTATIVENAGGRFFKAIGDAALFGFPAARVDDGVAACFALQHECEAYLANAGFHTRVVIKLNAGIVAVDLVGAPGREALDVLGKEVNIAASLASSGFSVTPALFRRLAPATRTYFRKHTPPVSYIGVSDQRPRGVTAVHDLARTRNQGT
jgi:class 3 adenylate cyclase